MIGYWKGSLFELQKYAAEYMGVVRPYTVAIMYDESLDISRQDYIGHLCAFAFLYFCCGFMAMDLLFKF